MDVAATEVELAMELGGILEELLVMKEETDEKGVEVVVTTAVDEPEVEAAARVDELKVELPVAFDQQQVEDVILSYMTSTSQDTIVAVSSPSASSAKG